jgi:sugar/nucleoside kinase (ribokinase family)
VNSAEHGVLVVGSVALDTVTTPAGHADEELGGSALYFAAAASLLAPVRVVAVVGEDFPRQRIAFLAERGVDLAGLETAQGRTFRWTGVYHEDLEGRDTLKTELNVFESFRPEIPAAWRDSRYVFLGNIDPALQHNVYRQLAAPAIAALDTMNFWIEGRRDALRAAIADVDVVVLNETEARELTGQHTLTQAIPAVSALGPRLVVVKKGPHGAILWDGSGLFQCPALPLDTVVDPTGAGDSFAGGFMGYLATRPDPGVRDFREAVVYGNVIASFAVESFGLRGLALATRDKVEERRRLLLRSISIDPD